jgi:hypothetical protein
MGDAWIATPESYFHARDAHIEVASNGVIVTMFLPGRARAITEDGPKWMGDRCWLPVRFVYTDWPRAREAVNCYMMAPPTQLVQMARVAFSEREADMFSEDGSRVDEEPE